MTLHLGLHSSGSSNRHGPQQQEIRDARKVLKECVRTDWDYPTLPAYQTNNTRVRQNASNSNVDGAENRIAGFRLHHTSSMYLKPRQWKHRDISCESSATSDEDDEGANKKSQGSLRSGDSAEDTGEWMFEGPDSVGTQIQDRQNARKRKRQHALAEEMAWNEGLALWTARRDAWCGAKTIEQVRAGEIGSASALSGEVSSTTANTSSSSEGSSPRSSTSASRRADSAVSPATSLDLEPQTSDLKPTMPENTAATAIPSTYSSSDILIPIAQPILANHPIRRRITPAIWPEIYNKIVIQGRAPSVPINLQTLTNALVQGWQSEGEWPPKPGPIERAFAHKKSKNNGEGGLRTGVRAAVGRVLRITHPDSGVVPEHR